MADRYYNCPDHCKFALPNDGCVNADKLPKNKAAEINDWRYPTCIYYQKNSPLVDNPHPNVIGSCYGLLPSVHMNKIKHDAFEAGASAMFKAVIKWGTQECDNTDHELAGYEVSAYLANPCRFNCPSCMRRLQESE